VSPLNIAVVIHAGLLTEDDNDVIGDIDLLDNDKRVDGAYVGEQN